MVQKANVTIARILFPLPLPEPFDYEVPEGMHVVPGAYVRAPMGPTERIGVVWAVAPSGPTDRELKTISEVYPAPPMSAASRQFVERMSRYVCTTQGQVLRLFLRSRQALFPSRQETVYGPGEAVPVRPTPARQKVIQAARQSNRPLSAARLAERAGVSSSVVTGLAQTGALLAFRQAVDPPFDAPDPNRKGFELTAEQARGAAILTQAVQQRRFTPMVIDGVTGSGKTEVYFEAIAEALRAPGNGQTLVLLPEIALTQAILTRFEKRFGSSPAPWHSGLSEAERRRTWREVAHGRARIVVGARSALFLPYARLSLIIVDEEHDSSFKQEEGTVYHARDMAVLRGACEGATVVMASATPALETLSNAGQGRYGLVKLAARPGAARLPDVDLIDLREDPPPKDHWLSPPLVEALHETFGAGQQSLLFLNRRGYAPLVLCKACGERLKSPGTENWLVEHRYTGRLVCHLTGFSMPRPELCPSCGARDTLMGVGPGVERVAEEVRALLPGARVKIFSSDTAQTGEDVRDIISSMATGDIDVLIGTQIVAKGHNFPGLTLVGVVDADAGMKGGDLRAGERTFQLLSQVAGRAGRADAPGRALIQTYQPESSLMAALAATDRQAFIDAELEGRELMGLPPYGRLGALILSRPDEEKAAALAHEIGRKAPNGDGFQVFGPAPAPIGVLRGRFRWRFLVQAEKGRDISAYMAAWRARLKLPSAARLSIDIDPYSFL